MARDATVSNIALRSILGALARAGIDIDMLLREWRLTPDALDPEGRTPAETVFFIWGETSRITGDEAFALHAAEAIPRVSLDILDFAMENSLTVADAVRRMTRYVRIVDAG